MQTVGSETSNFISVPLKDRPEEFPKDVRILRLKNESVLSMLVDKFYSQKHNPQVVTPGGESPIDKTPLAAFLGKFGLGVFVGGLADLGYREQISGFFLIPDKCFGRALDSLGVNPQQRSLFKQLRKELIQLKIDTDLAAQKQSVDNLTTKNSLMESSKAALTLNGGLVSQPGVSGRQQAQHPHGHAGDVQSGMRIENSEAKLHSEQTEKQPGQRMIYTLRYLPCQCCKRKRGLHPNIESSKKAAHESRLILTKILTLLTLLNSAVWKMKLSMGILSRRKLLLELKHLGSEYTTLGSSVPKTLQDTNF